MPIIDRSPDVEADISFLATEAGGKSNPTRSNYRPSHDFGLGTLNDAVHEYPDRECVLPGETARAHLWLLAPELQAGRLHPGFEFTVHEGTRVVAHGVVVKVVNAALRHGD